MYAGKSYTKAKAQAQSNANRTSTPRFIFLDTGGNMRIETAPPSQVSGGYETIQPRKETRMKDKGYMVIMESEEFGLETFPRDNLREALNTIKSLLLSAEALDDGITRTIGIRING
jgi:hypothetical protein